VALKPALIVIVPPGKIPRLDSGVPVVSAVLPMPVAGAPDVLVLNEPGAPVIEEVDAVLALEDELEEPFNKL
jgi:hypothetical protein